MMSRIRNVMELEGTESRERLDDRVIPVKQIGERKCCQMNSPEHSWERNHKRSVAFNLIYFLKFC